MRYLYPILLLAFITCGWSAGSHTYHFRENRLIPDTLVIDTTNHDSDQADMQKWCAISPKPCEWRATVQFSKGGERFHSPWTVAKDSAQAVVAAARKARGEAWLEARESPPEALQDKFHWMSPQGGNLLTTPNVTPAVRW